MVAMMQRRALLGGTLGAVTLATGKAESGTAMAQSQINHAPPEPLIWPAVANLPTGIRSFNGHTDTVLDVVGQIGLTPSRLVSIDETWAKTNVTRRHGRCSRGARLVAKVPQGRWRTLSFLAAMRHDRVTAPCVIDRPINGASFRLCRAVLGPHLELW
jgi:hypothetical protein